MAKKKKAWPSRGLTPQEYGRIGGQRAAAERRASPERAALHKAASDKAGVIGRTRQTLGHAYGGPSPSPYDPDMGRYSLSGVRRLRQWDEP